MHSLVVKIIFPHVCLDEGFAISIGIPPLDKVIIAYLHHGLSKHWFLICLLVSLLTHLLVVCVGRICLALCFSFHQDYVDE